MSTAQATAAKKMRFPCTAARKGISASGTSPPARNTALRMQTAPANITSTAIPAARTGKRASLPISQITGTANARFMPAYKTAFKPPVMPSGSEGTGFPLPYQNTKATKSGTRQVLSRAIPFVPRAEKQSTTKSPASEASGRADGRRASNPASIPAQGTNAIKRSAPFTAGAPRPKSARVAPSYPPYFFPSERKNAHPKKYRRHARKSAGRYPSEKNRTSSAPVIKPAPTLVPMRKNAIFSVFIPLVLCTFSPENAKKQKNLKIMSDIVL